MHPSFGYSQVFAKLSVVVLWSLMFLSPAALLILAVAGEEFSYQSGFPVRSLAYYLGNTVVLSLGGGAMCLLWGLSAAWLITHYVFPLRRQLRWLLLLPLACPVYLSGFIYADMLDGYPVSVRNMFTGILLFGINLYPYVYIFSRVAFDQQSADYPLAARSLGLNPNRVFWRVHLPMALPFVSFGFFLAVIEIVNDFGLVSYYAINTLSLGIYRTWLGLGSFSTALQLSLWLLLLLAVILLIENRLIGRRKRFENMSRGRKLSVSSLPPLPGMAACCFCLLPIIIGFVIPTGYLVYGASKQLPSFALSLLQPFANTLLLTITVILCCTLVGLTINYATRPLGSAWRAFGQSINICYALPGTLMGLAVIWIFTRINDLAGMSLLGGGLLALVYAYSVRFSSPMNRMLHNSLEKITPSVEKAARGFGISRLALFRKIHFPFIKTSILGATLIIFAETAKELPLALMLRPFNFETLATYTYQYASDERLAAASLPALALIAAGIPALYLLNLLISGKRGEHIV